MNETRGLWRGKCIDNGEWVEGFAVEVNVDNGVKCFIITNARWDSDDNSIDFLETTVYEVDPSTLGECTGLRDKNKKLIFEGDILEYPEYLERDVVEWDDEFAGFLLVDIDPAYTGVANLCEAIDGVIIGNIHDNPELLKGGK